MITRNELRQIPQLHRQIERDREQLFFLREKAVSIPSVLPDPNKVQTSPINNVNKYSDEVVDLNREIRKKEIELADLQHRAGLFITALPQETETERLTVKIMRMRYIKCYTWDEVAELTGYERSYIRKLERLALPCPPSNSV